MKKAAPAADAIGARLATLAKVLAALDRAQAKLTPLQEEATRLREDLLNTFKKTELNGARGSGLSLAIVTTASPKIADWEKFLAFAKRRGNDDLLQHSVSSPAWRERVEAKVAVPGVEVFTNVALRVTKSKKGEKP